jgi:hypothetical protein
MANIVDPNATGYSNLQIRPIADRFMQLYWACKSATADWTSKGLAVLIPNDPSAMIDGALTDGRTQITGGDINVLIAHMNTLIADFEATAFIKRNQIGKVAVNPVR